MRLNMGDNTKQVRVDNWGIFFLQRLQLFFSKTDYCDLTLQFEGNVQLKVHKLVMNACTDYFQVLEQTCSSDESIIMMPSDLQADVIVPIVNFMYTGMLEFQLNLYDKLYRTAQIMNITILTKLLDAQKQSGGQNKSLRKRSLETVQNPIVKKKPSIELPAPLPGRKLPIWKRKSIPTPTNSPRPVSHHSSDSLQSPDNRPKPTRFEWPDDDLPTINPMDSTFEEISYTSKPLLTKDEEQRARNANFDDLRSTANASKLITKEAVAASSSTIDMEEITDYVKQQKIRIGLNEEVDDGSGSRKQVESGKQIVKKYKFDEDDKETTINIATEGKTSDLDHDKIVAEILKKYPQLVKKNKNIRLKIMGNKKEQSKLVPKQKTTDVQKIDSAPKSNETKTWTCHQCSTPEEPQEFALYYLYRKHMTDLHHEKFDPMGCRYCGLTYKKENLLMYHLHTKHVMKVPRGFDFPKCDQCPFIALNVNCLSKHKLKHGKDEMQCTECNLTFTNNLSLNCHMQITGHNGKNLRSNYDCQYCTKKLQNSMTLFAHVRSTHRNEASRDGYVSIEDDDECYEDEDSDDEYILPEIISPQKKVNILSNVRVEESSEAEAFNNVASGIATSLGLVDIVVLNDNRQILFDPNEASNTQQEFILPELTEENQLATSTDELVMVLTDHDYDENQGQNVNDSNIVVLYSHPVTETDPTSESELMIELKNGTTEAESIEMIQKEIESHQIDEKVELIEEKHKVRDELIESLKQGEQLELVARRPLEEQTPDSPKDAAEDTQKENVTATEELKPTNEFTTNVPEVTDEEHLELTESVMTENGTEELEKNVNIEVKDDLNLEVIESVKEQRDDVKQEVIRNVDAEMTVDDNQEVTKSCKEEVMNSSNEEVTETGSKELKEEVKEEMPVKVTEQINDSSSEKIADVSEEVTESVSELKQELTGTEAEKTEETVSTTVTENNVESTSEENQSAKIAILDDWDDTDSQHSDPKDKTEEAGKTVDKLMDDWEDEEEEESNKKVSGGTE